MKRKLPVLILTLFLVLTLVPAAFAKEADDEVSDFCLDATTYLQPEEGFPHPVGASIAARYQVEYSLVMSWFCDGYGFGQIMLALETSKLSSEAPEDLLALRTYGFGWGEGFGPPPWAGGPPEWAGSEHTDDEEGEGFGPPPWAGGPPLWAGPKFKPPTP
ncbi:MAG: hypothetical protein R6V73_13330 [Anaerolineales bacterium]